MPGPKKKRLTPERRAELDSAMEATDGNLVDTSKILSCNVETLKKWIANDDIMLRKWKPEWIKDEDADESIHRPRQLTAVQRRELAIAKEEESLKEGFRELGVDDETTAYLVTVAGFTNGRIEGVTDLLTGGMSASAINMIDLVRRLKEDADKIAKNPDRYSEVNDKGVVVYSGWKKLKEVRQQIAEYTKELRNLSKDIRDMRIADAKIEEIRRVQKEREQDPKKTPGFGPPEVYGNPKLTQNNYYGNQIKEAEKE